ncbi:hypothetical protein HC031_30190 [Planosporangium thailandense]|uniref:Pecanex-like protein 1 n=1 Tax=Planosporangium thailandense TaxID=765197 RepID=A0ABX0Y6D5_9ACTN|nr:hypothetical protein [Planosporangium thailandense]
MAAVATVLVVFGALLTVQRVSSAKTLRPVASAKCGPVAPGAAAPNGQQDTVTVQNGRQVRSHWGDGQQPNAGCPQATQAAAQTKTVNCPSVADKLPNVPPAAKSAVDQDLAQLDSQIANANNKLAANQRANQTFINNQILAPLKNARATTLNRITTALNRTGAQANNLGGLAACTVNVANNNGGGQNNGGQNNGGNNGGQNNGGQNNNGGKNPNVNDPNNLGILAQQCQGSSKLQPHDGFQNGNRCVATNMGEVGDAAKNPSLLITQAPQQVQAGQPFQIRVSTRNLIRDRFLAAAKGGYYVEMSLLDAQGLTRGHFHTACRMLDNTQAAPDPSPPPAFFVATEDNGGSAQPDQIVINVPGLPQRGVAQCASWAGDGSHRIPMMQRANEIPAFDAVRITVN